MNKSTNKTTQIGNNKANNNSKQNKIIKKSETKIEKKTIDPIIKQTLLNQITDANKKIAILYKNPKDLTSDEINIKSNISKPYIRRNHAIGILSEKEKQLYYDLFKNKKECDNNITKIYSPNFIPFFEKIKIHNTNNNTNSNNSEPSPTNSIDTCFDYDGFENNIDNNNIDTRNTNELNNTTSSSSSNESSNFNLTNIKLSFEGEY